MQTALIIIVAVLAAVVLAYVLMVRSHRAWVARQTPAGVWRADFPQGHLMLQFDGGRSEGTYRQVAVNDGVTVRESGTWQHASGRLQLVVLATDEAEHPGLGASTAYMVRYLAPDEIGIEGPHRPRLVYKRAAEGIQVDAEPMGAYRPA